MSQRTVPHCHPNYDVPSLSTADLKLKLSSRLSYVHPSHLIVIAVMHAALKKSHVLMIRTHSEWCCHIWFTLKQKCKGLTERSLSLRCAVYVTVIFGYELLLFRFTFCIECLIFMFSNPQFHLPRYGIFYLSFFISDMLSMAYLAMVKTRQICDHSVKISVSWTPPVNMNMKVIANIYIRNGPLDRKTRLSYINFQHCFQWSR